VRSQHRRFHAGRNVSLRRPARRSWSLLALGLVTALVLAACGSSTTSSGGGGTSSAAPTSVPTSGPGLTSPTTGSGARIKGGTVYFTEGSQAPPTYIFPLYDFAECTTTNSNQFEDLMYRPLYWYGNNYRPTIDYNYSIGQQPVFSNNDRTITIHLNHWMWSNGETVTSRDIEFWLNVIDASPSTEWCGTSPGYFPFLISSYSAPNPSTFVLHLNKSYDPEWLELNVLSQLTPMPMAWDRTSLSGPTPTASSAHLPDTTKSGAAAVYKFLNAQALKPANWVGSKLWSVVDGPFKLANFTTSGQATFVPNPTYSGSPKPSISKFVELPFTSEDAIYNEIKSQGPSAITVANIPAQYAAQAPQLAAEGYTDNKAASYSFNYFPLNLNTSGTTSPGGEPVRYIFRQTYFRQAFQHLVDQQGWIAAYLHNTASPTCGPIPLSPPSPLVSSSAVPFTPCAFSVSDATKLLTSHGWKVVPGGTTTCQDPSKCGTGIKKGEGISFNLDYQSGVVAIEDEMNDLASVAAKVGIKLNLTSHPFQTVVGAAVPCAPSSATCKWEAENWGAGWIYGPDYLPTGEPLYVPGAAANAGSFSDPTVTSLIVKTITGPLSQESSALAAYARAVSTADPVIFGPTSIGTYQGDAGTLVDKKLGGYAANALGFLNPEAWYFTK
jgi:peptide/nickel transport system substrate-binding protein